MIGDSPDVIDALQRLGGGQDLVDAYLAATLQILGLIAAGYAVQAMLRLRGEETGGRAEPCSPPRSRARAGRSATRVALAGTAALLAVGGRSPPASATRSRPATPAQLPRVLGAALAQVPAAWVLAGLALALFGLAPRAAAAGLGRARRAASRSASSARCSSSPQS